MREKERESEREREGERGERLFQVILSLQRDNRRIKDKHQQAPERLEL